MFRQSKNHTCRYKKGVACYLQTTPSIYQYIPTYSLANATGLRVS